MNALVISGGGSRGAFAVGALEVLRESGRVFDFIAGTSTGALIAPMAAIGELPLLRSIYTSVETEDILHERNPIEILLQDSIYDSRPLWSLITSFITPERFQHILEAEPDLYLTTVNLQTGRVVYWNPRSSGPDGGAMTREAFLRAVLASASIPVMMPAVRIFESGDQYVDGGIREIAPLSIAIDHGATDLYAIVLSPEDPERVEESFGFLLNTLMRTVNLFTQEVLLNDVFRAQTYNRALAYWNEVRERAREKLSEDEMTEIFEGTSAPNPFTRTRRLNLHLIRPEHTLPATGLEFDPVVMSQMMEMGRIAAEKALDRGPLEPPAV